ncbi:MAG: threonylcarbamoyl-AMP synthase [Synergistales bacterium]|nr:threonylcarbamoyl-AMP synthase [Synergistales bacterium]
MTAKVIPLDWFEPDISLISEAAQIIRRGGLVAFPTETVYGLGANAMDEDAVLSIFRAKGRPADNPLIVHVHSLDQLDGIVSSVTPLAEKLMHNFWPGPLTLVISSRKSLPSVVTAGLDTVAVRMPSNPIARELIRISGVPIAAPSANRSGRPSPTDAGAVFQDLAGSIDLILDAGPTYVGVESTVVDVTGQEIILLRPGGTSLEALERIAGPIKNSSSLEESKRSPGTRYRHYAPLVPLILWEEGESFLQDLPCDPGKAGYVGMVQPEKDLSENIIFKDIESYARGLFSALRDLESRGVQIIIAQLPPSKGIGRALRDRLKRASGD